MFIHLGPLWYVMTAWSIDKVWTPSPPTRNEEDICILMVNKQIKQVRPNDSWPTTHTCTLAPYRKGRVMCRTNLIKDISNPQQGVICNSVRAQPTVFILSIWVLSKTFRDTYQVNFIMWSSNRGRTSPCSLCTAIIRILCTQVSIRQFAHWKTFVLIHKYSVNAFTHIRAS